MKIEGTTAVVTGAASELGAATAGKLASRGATVVGFDRDVVRTNNPPPPPGVQLVPVDVTDPEAIQAGLDVACNGGAPLRIVVNCAGIAPSARILSRKGVHDLDLFETVVRVNLLGTFNVLALAAERIAAGEPDENGQRGVITNTASIAAYEAQIGQVAYGSSKGGVISLTIAAARDLYQRRRGSE